MRRRLFVAISLAASSGAAAAAASEAMAETAQPASRTAKGRFDVTLVPQPPAEDVPNGRMTLRKTFHGDLAGTSSGEMLTSSDARDGSGAYVAVERFTGQLAGREGSFYLVHRGIMDQGRADLSIAVVPGSGTGELQGLTGTLELDLASKQHDFVFTYTLPDKAAQ